MKWNISVIRGIKTNKYSVSTGEGMRKHGNYKFLGPIKNIVIIKNSIK